MNMQRLLWNVAPISITNVVEMGAVDASFSKSIARTAIAAFDEYVTTRRGRQIPKSVGSVDASSEEATLSLNRTRRRRRTINTRASRGDESIATAGTAAAARYGENATTDNDHFFEYQRIRGYHLSTETMTNSPDIDRLRSDIIPSFAASYLRNERFPRTTHALAQSLLEGSSANLLSQFSVDIWAAIQRGDGAHHPDHVHDGAVLSGVYYAAIPEGSAPLCLRRPVDAVACSLADAVGTLADASNNERQDEKRIQQNDNGDVLFWPREGDLILFPPWLYHGVPMADSNFGAHTANTSSASRSSSSLSPKRNNAARVSLAFNITCPFYIGEPWNATRVRIAKTK